LEVKFSRKPEKEEPFEAKRKRRIFEKIVPGGILRTVGTGISRRTLGKFIFKGKYFKF
jgi:hypothetical protein